MRKKYDSVINVSVSWTQDDEKYFRLRLCGKYFYIP